MSPELVLRPERKLKPSPGRESEPELELKP